MPSKKFLQEQIDDLEAKNDSQDRVIVQLQKAVRELQNDLSHDVEVRENTPCQTGGTYVTTCGKLNAIAEHLGLEIEGVPPEITPPTIKVTKPRKNAKKGKK